MCLLYKPFRHEGQLYANYQDFSLDLHSVYCKISIWIKTPINEGRRFEHRI